MLERLALLVGEENLEKLKNSTVLIVGVGGVGGYAVEALARTGIGNLILIDPDKVDITNINRQLVALKSTIGLYKVDVLKKRIEDMGLNTRTTTHKVFLTMDNLDLYLDGVDYVIDACDTLLTKFAIIKKCKERGISFVSSMGTGNKLDPTRLSILKLSNTSYDPLAKRLRKMVKENHIKGDIMVVASTEEKHTSAAGVIPSNAFVPATSGMICASYVVNQIIK